MGKHQTIGFATMPAQQRIQMQPLYEQIIAEKKRTGNLNNYLLGLMNRIDLIQRPPLACKAGCHHCCHQQVTISEAESRLIFRHNYNYKLIADHKSTLLHQKKYKCFDYHYADEYSRCIFLNHYYQCSIYPIRPLVCHSCAVPAEGNPELCKVNGSPQIYSIHYEIETIISAFWHGESVKPLPVYMLNELNRLERK